MTLLPDTTLVREAQAAVSAILAPEVLRHSLRTFLLGQAYAETKHIAFDEEDLCVAALFHDVGLFVRPRGLAFPLASSRSLEKFLSARGVARGRVAAMVDAIDFHMQLRPRWKDGPVVGLLHIGAWMDATGRGRRAIDAAARTIYEALPAGDFAPLLRKRIVASLDSFSACAGLLFPRRFGTT
jgi:hypothetical protein